MMKMRYVFLRENNLLKAALCCFPFRKHIAGIKIPLLEVGSPLATSPAFFSPDAHHTSRLLEEVEKIRKEEKTKGTVISFLNKKELASIRGQLKDFTEIPMLEDTYIDLHFKTFDDFLTSLPEEAWRSARMTLNRAKRWKIKPLFTNDFARWMGVARALQGYLCQKHRDYEWYLTEQFYESAGKNLKDTAELLLFFKGDLPLASAVVLNSPAVAHYRFAGVDPRYRKYHAYFLIYYEGIRRAIEREQQRVYFGITTYAFKEKIGCVREPLYQLVKLENPLLNAALKPYKAFSSLR